jgi:hypothetical protein
MARVNGFTRVRHEDRVVGHRCTRCDSLVSSYFVKQHRCAVARTGARPENQGELRLRCWESVFQAGRIEGRCPCCRGSRIRYRSTSGSTFQMMHIVPRAQGGANASWNLLPGCGCNQNMASVNLVDWMGTRGNKRHLLKRVMLRKYRSLVAPVHRSRHDRYQLLEWVRQLYHPKQLDEYEQWLLLQADELRHVMK